MQYHTPQSERAKASPREEWPTHAPPPPPPMPDEEPPAFSIARPARLLGIAWALSVPAILWSHIKFNNPIALAIVGGGIAVVLCAAVVLSWIVFHSTSRSRAAASGVFGGLASIGLAANILLGVFTSLAADALREVNQRPAGLRAQLSDELTHAKTMASAEITKARKDGIQAALKHPVAEPKPAADHPSAEPAPKPVPAEPTLAANAAAAVSIPTKSVVAVPPKAEPAPRAPKPAPQMVVPQRGVVVRKPGSPAAQPVVAPMDADAMDRVSRLARDHAQDKIDRSTRRYAESAIALASLHDPLLYTREGEFREYMRVLDEHYDHAVELRDAIADAPADMHTRLSIAGVPAAQVDPAVNSAFPPETTAVSVAFRDSYIDWLIAREARAMVLESSLGRWKYNASNKQLWLADDWVRTAWEGAFESLKQSNQVLAAKRVEAEDMGIPTRLKDMTNGEARLANEAEGN